MRFRSASDNGLCIIAFIEGAKGILVLMAGFGLLAMIHRDLHHLATQILRQFHLNPAHQYPRIFLDLADRVTDTKLWVLALAALTYAVARIVEAIGLRLQKRWAEIFGVLTGGIYLPIELYELLNGVTWPKLLLLAVNAGIVWYLFVSLTRTNDPSRRTG